MKQGGGTIDTNALANGRGLSTGSPSVAPVWNSTATVKTSTPTSYIPSYTSWYPTAHQDTMQQPQLMWTRTAKTTPPLYPPTAQFRGPDTGQSLCGLHTPALRSPDQMWKQTTADTLASVDWTRVVRAAGEETSLFLNWRECRESGSNQSCCSPPFRDFLLCKKITKLYPSQKCISFSSNL